MLSIWFKIGFKRVREGSSSDLNCWFWWYVNSLSLHSIYLMDLMVPPLHSFIHTLKQTIYSYRAIVEYSYWQLIWSWGRRKWSKKKNENKTYILLCIQAASSLHTKQWHYPFCKVCQCKTALRLECSAFILASRSLTALVRGLASRALASLPSPSYCRKVESGAAIISSKRGKGYQISLCVHLVAVNL